jgi:hypothetical protein
MTDPFLMPFVDEIINEVVGHEYYSFTDGFSSYNQVPITKEDKEKTTFVFELRSYKVMLFGLKNTPTVVFRIMVKEFQEYIYKTMAVYFDEYTIYNILKYHIEWLRMMMEICQEIQLSLNIKKCIFTTPIGIVGP